MSATDASKCVCLWKRVNKQHRCSKFSIALDLLSNISFFQTKIKVEAVAVFVDPFEEVDEEVFIITKKSSLSSYSISLIVMCKIWSCSLTVSYFLQ